jgi:shikimate dehydrogenase
MNRYALIGEKLGHSYSKLIHERYFSLSGRDSLTYELIQIPKQNLKEEFARISKEFAGINVTIPYKIDVMQFLDGISDEAQKIGAVNTVKFTDGGAFGYNTDYFGFKHTLEANAISIKGKNVVILGTGGASKAAVNVCKDLGAADITFVSTRPSVSNDCKVIGYNDKIKGDVLINCTPVGMYPNVDKSPLNELDSSFTAVVDMIYNPSVTCLMQKASDMGKKAVNGLMMLTSQAIYAEAIWHGEEVNKNIIDTVFNELKE